MWDAGETITTQAPSQFRKRPGAVFLTSKRLAWVPQGGLAPTVSVLHNDIKNLFVNAEGSAKVMIKIVEVKPDTSHGFIFTSSAALAERDAFKDGISGILATRQALANANGTSTGGGAGSSPSTGASPTMSDASAPGTPRMGAGSGAGGMRRGLNGSGPSAEMKLRFALLKQNKDLAMLHKDLVMGKHVSEEEFWETRKHLLRNQAVMDHQQKGQSSAWLDLKPETGESNDVKYVMTPQVIHSVCQQYPSSKFYIRLIGVHLLDMIYFDRFVTILFPGPILFPNLPSQTSIRRVCS